MPFLPVLLCTQSPSAELASGLGASRCKCCCCQLREPSWDSGLLGGWGVLTSSFLSFFSLNPKTGNAKSS